MASADAGRLWVDKYAPRAFRELLSEDRFNRQVLRWIKQWDPHVFGVQRPPAKRRRAPPQPGRFTSPAKPWAGGRGGGGGGDAAEKQILLIGGPPGLGKTTLAHVAARRAGTPARDQRVGRALGQGDARARQRGDRRPGGLRRSPPRSSSRRDVDGAMSGAEGSGAINELIRIAAPQRAPATTVTTTTAPAAAAARRRRALRGCSGR